jgi:hypothetical protein
MLNWDGLLSSGGGRLVASEPATTREWLKPDGALSSPIASSQAAVANVARRANRTRL